jgi:hypothetical protein
MGKHDVIEFRKLVKPFKCVIKDCNEDVKPAFVKHFPGSMRFGFCDSHRKMANEYLE